MKHLPFIQQLDHQSNSERLKTIVQWLNANHITYQLQPYSTGTNLVVDLGQGPQRIGISSHFDRVPTSAGANDNGSAIAVCLDIIERFQAATKRQSDEGNSGLSLRIFFFDEEETGLKGASAYVRKHGIHDLQGLINMELVGMGDQFALWPVDSKADGKLLGTFELLAAQRGISCSRFDQIVTNTADHLPFRMAGLADVFTITCISDHDIAVASKYYAALASGANEEALFRILSQAPLFTHYHQPTDTYDRLSEASIRMTAATIWDTVTAVQENK